jgi:hypothetical protein
MAAANRCRTRKFAYGNFNTQIRSITRFHQQWLSFSHRLA